ncbi:MAG TPA: tRNA (adenosine(37)-N6)-threonylcarbamoyltransferase complex ATPase subunit type 1 TsaE [Candidatus Omnitrophota bacterium]|nr:tRNA (adenosine(37)-N6)-threonylcarbamoyltransferase complex ATPase subunit type 1 TsaE [Candidatus Omnitrophota bacterium]
MRPRNAWLSSTPGETIERGRFIAKTLHPGSVVALEGDLGSGKTTLVKGIALGLGVKSAREVKSPTFVILHIYRGRIPLHHFDLYRLDQKSDLEGIGLEEFLADPKAVSVIEWADRIPEVSKQADLVVKLASKGKDKREIKLYSHER